MAGGGLALTLKEVYALNSLLLSDEGQTFEQLSSIYNRDFSKNDNLKVGISILSLLREQDLMPRPTQRLISLFLLFDMYKHEQLNHNPFLAVFLKLLNPTPDEVSELIATLPTLTNQERYFVVTLLARGTGSDLLKRTPQQIMQLDIQTAVNYETNHLEAAITEIQGRFSANVGLSLPSALRSPDADASSDVSYSEQRALLKTWEQFLTGQHPSAFNVQKPKFHRIAPPLHVSDDEYCWFNSIELHKFVPLWDPNMKAPAKSEPPPVMEESRDMAIVSDWTTETGDDLLQTEAAASSETTEESWQKSVEGSEELNPDKFDAIEILNRSLHSQLQMQEAQWLIEQLRKDGLIVQKVNMTPDKLPALVEDNPMVAVEVLLILLPSKEITSYFESLISMELSVHGMEVVNRLTSMIDVPEEFLNVYVSQCILACEGMKDAPFTQNRLVRMVCVFLSSLIRNKLINVQDLYIELQAFCINFSAVREAAALFQTVQMMNREGPKDDDHNAGN